MLGLDSSRGFAFHCQVLRPWHRLPVPMSRKGRFQATLVEVSNQSYSTACDYR